MQQQYFQEEPFKQNVPVTDAETKAVVQLWAERQGTPGRAAAGPTVHDIAEALSVSPEEAERLLEEVRARESKKQLRIHTPPLHTQRVKLAAFAALFLVGMLLLFSFLLMRSSVAPPEAATPATVVTPEEHAPTPPPTIPPPAVR